MDVQFDDVTASLRGVIEDIYGPDLGWDPVPVEEYDPTPLDREYSEGDETEDIFQKFWFPQEKPIDTKVYKGTDLEWDTLEDYRAVHPR